MQSSSKARTSTYFQRQQTRERLAQSGQVRNHLPNRNHSLLWKEAQMTKEQTLARVREYLEGLECEVIDLKVLPNREVKATIRVPKALDHIDFVIDLKTETFE